MSFLVVANFKSHKTVVEVESWLKDVTPIAHDSSCSIIVAPSFPHLSISPWPSAISLAAQDCSPFPPGSYTGAINALQLKDLSVTYCLVGHSERRQYFHETSLDVANKAQELLAVDITPIICLRPQDLPSDYAALDQNLISRSYFCYEPPGDIGGTQTAEIEDIRQVTTQIKQLFHTPRVMYGGSVGANNITTLIGLDLAGVIVSTACLDSASFNQILAQLSHVKI